MSDFEALDQKMRRRLPGPVKAIDEEMQPGSREGTE